MKNDTQSESSSESRRPNVIIMLTDDQGTLDVNCYGAKHLHTPNMDRLAETGVKLDRAYCHTVCCPSRAGLLTGRYTQRCGINFWTQNDRRDPDKGININADETTIAEYLRRAGYRTGLFGKWHLGAAEGNGPLDMGFDEFFGHLGGFIENYTHYFLHGTGFHDLWEGNEEIDRRDEYFPRMMNDQAIDFIDRNQDNEFLLYLAYNLPHYPEQSEDKYGQYYETAEDRVRQYGMTVSTVDGLIGEVIDKLEETGLRDNTIVVFMSDNGHSQDVWHIEPNHSSGLPEGWDYGAHGAGYTGPYIGSKGDLTEGGVRVPCIVSAPGLLPQGESRGQAVVNFDWLPTLLELCGLDEPGDRQIDGQSVVKVLRDADASPPHDVVHWQWGSDWAVMEGDWKLIGSNTGPERRLLYIADSVPEKEDKSGGQPELLAHLEELHASWLADVKCGYLDGE